MAELLKNIFFTKESIQDLSDTIKKNYPDFNQEKFGKMIFTDQWGLMELKEKMHHVSTCLHNTLPSDFMQTVKILETTAPGIKGFDAMALPDYVEQYGLDQVDRSLQALAHFTKYSSSEFAIRPFLIRYPEKVMDYLLRLADDEDHHVRRFASEGCRPRLPWAMTIPFLKNDPSPILPILEKLKDDESDFVRNSVANNLNDISKDHADIVISLAQKWMEGPEKRKRLIKRALRTLLKNGHPDALNLFGFGKPASVKMKFLMLSTPTIKIGETSSFIASFENSGNEISSIRLEYAIYYRKANGSLSKKIFQVLERDYDPGEYKVKRKISFKDMSTRKHYPGEHFISFIINGIEQQKEKFTLVH